MDHPSKRITYCFMISLVACSIATIVLTCVNFAHINGDTYDFVDIANNWQTGAVMDVTVSSYCPQGYQEAFNYTWPGTVTGCWCGDASFFWKSFYNIYYDMSVGSCSWNETKAGCYNINSEPSVNLDVWGQYNGTNVKVCVQRSQETWLQVANQSGPGCNNNTALKQCGFSPDNIFCTTGTQCPINSVQFVNLTLPAQNAKLLNCTPANNCTIIAQNPTYAKVFYYTRGDTFDALPTAQMRLNEYSMCDDSTENDITPGRTDFKLMASTRSTCHSEGASMWNWTDSMTEAQLFNLNGLTSTINYLEHFGYYSDGEDGSDYIYSVFSRSYIPWSISCRGSMSTLVNNASSISKLRVVQLVLMIFTILSGLALGIGLPILLRQMLDDNSSGLRRVAMTVNYVAKIPTLGLQIAVLIISKNTKGFFLDIMDDNCSTAEVTQTLSSLADHLQQNYVCNAINIAFQVLLFFIGIGYFHRPSNMYQQDYNDSVKPFYDPQAPEQRPVENYQVTVDDQSAAQYGYNQTQAPEYFQGAIEDQPPQPNGFYAPPAENQFNNNQPYGY